MVVDEAWFRARVGDYLGGQIIEAFDRVTHDRRPRGARRAQRVARFPPRAAAPRRRAGHGRAPDLPAPRRHPRHRARVGVRAGARPARRRRWRRHRVRSPPRALPRTCWPSPGCARAGRKAAPIVANVLAVGHVPIAVGPEAPVARPARRPHRAWHDLPDPIPPHGMRRRRRIDVVPPVSPHEGLLAVDAMFRDSYVTAGGVETVVHEYTFTADVDPVTRRRSCVAEAIARALPFAQCPEAAGERDPTRRRGPRRSPRPHPGRVRRRHDVHAPQRHAPGLRRRRRARRPRRCAVLTVRGNVAGSTRGCA